MKTRTSYIDIAIVLLVVFVIVLSVIFEGISTGIEYSRSIGIITVLTVIIAGYSLKRINSRWFTLIFLFELSYILFTLGQSLLYGIGIEIKIAQNLYVREPVSAVNRSFIYSLMCFYMLHIGVLLRLRHESKHKQEVKDYESEMKTIGWIGLIVSAIPYIIEMSQLITAYYADGYRLAFVSISGKTSWAKASSYIADLFPICCFMLLIAYKDQRIKRRNIAVIIITMIIAHFLIGNRSEPICYIMAMLWLYQRNTNSKQSSIKSRIVTAMIVTILLLIIPIIGRIRNDSEISLNMIIEGIMGEDSIIDLIVTTIASLGYTDFTTIKTMQLIPSIYPYHYGVSYIFAVLALFPNIFGGIHPSVKHAALAQWLMKALNMGTGPGFSMPAEAYYNFGWYGFLIMPIIGYIIACVLDERVLDGEMLRTFTAIGGFIILFSIPRRDTLTAVRGYIYTVGILYMAVKLLYNRNIASKVYNYPNKLA